MPVVMPVEPVAPEALNCGWSTLAVWNTGAWIEPEAEEPWSLDCWSLSIGVGFENSLPNTSNSSAFRRRSPDSGELSSAAARILSSFAISVSVCLSACTFRLLIRPVEQEEEFNKLDSRKLKFTFKRFITVWNLFDASRKRHSADQTADLTGRLSIDSIKFEAFWNDGRRSLAHPADRSHLGD